ncbi:MAG: AAA family ATPase [Planctomycetota bacterium]
MYESYWGFTEKPFQNTPDPRFFYYSSQHEEVLNRLLYTVQEKLGAGMLTGIFGCGKTLICQTLIKELTKTGQYKIALISNPQLSHIELLRTVAYHLGVPNLPVKKSEIMTDYLVQVIGESLNNNHSDGKHTIIIIDESHLINDYQILEELRLLLNFQLPEQFLLTLLLVGQPELRKNIESNKQLSQRIAIRCHLEQFNVHDTKNYILHRLKVAGQTRPIFGENVFKLIHEGSGGIPRRINHICNISLLGGFSKEMSLIDTDIVQDAIKEMGE